MTKEFKTLGELLTYMGKLVERKLTNYKSDFYKYDTESLNEADEKESFSYVWLLRDTGTWLTANASLMASFLTEPHDMYVITKTKEHTYLIQSYGKVGLL